ENWPCQVTSLMLPGRPPLGTASSTPSRKPAPRWLSGSVVTHELVAVSNDVVAVGAGGEEVEGGSGTVTLPAVAFPLNVIVWFVKCRVTALDWSPLVRSSLLNQTVSPAGIGAWLKFALIELATEGTQRSSSASRSGRV